MFGEMKKGEGVGLGLLWSEHANEGPGEIPFGSPVFGESCEKKVYNVRVLMLCLEIFEQRASTLVFFH